MKTIYNIHMLAAIAAFIAIGQNLHASEVCAQDAEPTIETHFSEGVDDADRMERQRKRREENDARQKKSQAEFKERAQKRVEKALEDLAAINGKRQNGDQPDTSDALTNDYFNALLNVTRAYDFAVETAKALENFKQAADVLKAQSARLTIANKTHFIQSKFAHYPDDAEGDKNFLAYVDVCMTPDLSGAVSPDGADRVYRLQFDRAVLTAIEPHRAKEDKPRLKILTQQLLALYDAKRGSNSPTLSSFLKRYASLCMSTKDLPEAEKALERVCSLDYKSNSSNTDTAFCEKLNLAYFYLTHNMVPKAAISWRATEEQIDIPFSDSLTAAFCRLAKQYKEAGFDDQMLAIYAKLLARGGDPVLKNLDDPLEQLVKGYFSNFSYAQAETVIKQRLSASAKSRHDSNATFWRVKQSDLYLATGRVAESNKIFNDILANLALQNISTDSLREDRAKLLQQLGKPAESAALRKTVAVHQQGPVTVRFGMQAKQNIVLGQNTAIEAYDSNIPDQRPLIQPLTPGGSASKATIACGGKVEIQGNLNFRGTISGTISDTGRAPQSGPMGATITAAPADVAKMPDAMSAPDNTPLLGTPMQDRGAGGDYILDLADANRLRQMSIMMMTLRADTKTPMRIYISDKNAKSETIDLSSIPNFGRRGIKPENMQFWYDGIRPIKLTSAGAFVYAPNAAVTIPFNGSFNGAIVAARIILEGNNRVLLDQSLINKTFQP